MSTYPHYDPTLASEGHHDRCAQHIDHALRCTCDHERAWDACRSARTAEDADTRSTLPPSGGRGGRAGRLRNPENAPGTKLPETS